MSIRLVDRRNVEQLPVKTLSVNIDELMIRLKHEQVYVNIETKHGSKLVDMRILQLLGDTFYLTDKLETMAILHIKCIDAIELLEK